MIFLSLILSPLALVFSILVALCTFQMIGHHFVRLSGCTLPGTRLAILDN